MKLNTGLDKGNWVDWEEGASFQLRPYPITQIESIKDDDLKSQVEQTLKMFKYCIVDWKGLEDEEGEKIPCNEKWKQYMFDHYADIRDFVLKSINNLMGLEDRELKN